MFSRTKDITSEKIENIIGPTAHFNGHLKTEGTIRIDGTFEGTIETTASVIIGEGAKLEANITARNVSVSGAVKGNLNVSGRLEILAKGQIWGDISTASLVIDDGGFLRGTSTMPGEADPLLIEPPKPRRLKKGEVVEASATVVE